MLKKFGKLLKAKKNTQKARTIENVAIFGFADSLDNSNLFRSVFAVAEKLAEAGYVVVNGGGPGVMKAASMGAKKAHGKVIGVTLYPDDMDNFEGRDPANILDVEIKTSNYLERTLTLLQEGQVYVIFQGGTGTISEFGMAWGMARLYFGHHKPLILYGNFWKKIIKAFKETMPLRAEELKVFKIVDSPEDVLSAIAEFEVEIEQGEHKHMKASKGGFII